MPDTRVRELHIFSPDGKYVVTVSNKEVRLEESRAGRPLPHSAELNFAIYAPGGGQILTGGQDGVAQLWRPDGSLIASFKDFSRTARSAAFSPDGKVIALTSDDNLVPL